MKVSGLIGVVVGGLSIALGATIEGSNVAAIINIPALFIVLGGTLGASMGGANFDAF